MTDLDILLTQDFLQRFKNVAIYRTSNNVYELFEKYSLTIGDSFKLIRFSDDIEQLFTSSQTATTWATLDMLNKVVEAKHVLRLDQQLSGILFEIELHKRKTHDDISLNKLTELRHRLKTVSKQLVEYVELTKHWQLRQFSKKV
jgi:hypothetical protein